MDLSPLIAHQRPDAFWERMLDAVIGLADTDHHL